MLRTSNIQAIGVDHDKSVYATGRCNRAAHFRVHKVDEGGIRMFESIIYPGFYLRFKDGKFDCNVSTVILKCSVGYFILLKCKYVLMLLKCVLYLCGDLILTLKTHSESVLDTILYVDKSDCIVHFNELLNPTPHTQLKLCTS